MGYCFNMCKLTTSLLPLLLFFYLIPSTHCSYSFPMQLRCHDDEHSALVQFKESLIIITNSCYDNPFGYSKLESWKHHQGERGDCCSWDGVECDEETNHVISLDLSNSCLFGSINSNSSLFTLFHLQRLNLAYNNFSFSQIPSEVGSLSMLTHLNLSSSSFSGQIPPQISNLCALVSLDLSYNYDLKLHKPLSLRGLVQYLTNLKELDLSIVNISSEVPDVLAKFSSLESLCLSDCGLRGQFPIGIFQLPNLKILDLSQNSNLKGYLPPFQLGSPLRSLILDSTNFIGELPSSIANLANLEELSISSSNFTGHLPSSLSNLTNLTYLDLSDNRFSVTNSSSFSWIGKLSKLTYLFLFQVNLNGEIPSSFLNLTQVSYLDLGHNQLTGQIPSWLMNLTYLDHLFLDHNHLSQIPSCLIYQTGIRVLCLTDNQLSGEIPSQINNNSEIRVLELASNKLQGSIPSTLSTLKNLETLNLYSNNLDGAVDLNIFFQIKSLQKLMLSFNNLWLLSPSNTKANNIPSFTILGLASCNLSEFPTFLRYQNELQFLDLSSNNIHRPAPWWIWNISTNSLQYMNLSHNFLTGFEVAPLVWQWADLRILDLESNMLEGSLSFPSTWRNECNLRLINLGHNRLQGQVPKWLANCSMLEFLNLGENQFNDSFPSWLGNLPKLKVLILRSNGFNGTLGKIGTANFPELQIIDLSQNKLSGNIPIAYFEIWNAMKIADANHMTYMGTNNEKADYFPAFAYDSFFYSTRMSNKGSELEYLKIPSAFAAIDFSFNKFEGVIPDVIANLRGIRLPNFSNNILTGHIPSSMENMKELECLDLSGNQLSGEIPFQLTKLTFLSSFNVSFNNLSGPIPQGNQFDTFESTSYEGNLGLCGVPLKDKCANNEGSPPTHSTSGEDENEEESGSLFKFSWMIVLMGYGSGLVIGVVAGNEFYKRKQYWFVRTLRRQKKRIRPRQ